MDIQDWNWNIIKWVITIVSGVIGILFRWIRWGKKKTEIENKDPKVDWTSYVFVEPFSFTLIVYIAMTLTEFRLVNFGDYLGSKPEITQLSKKLNQTYSDVGNNKILSSIVDDKVKKLKTFTDYATNNDKVMIIEKNTNEFLESAYKIFQYADMESIIDATSYVEPDDWWNV